jgi:nonsense-mediated mRNA decay protein 3
MRNKFCFICGKQAYKDGYCEQHWGERNKLAELPEKIEFVQCPKCDLVKERNRWVKPDFDKIIKGAAKTHGEVDAWEITPLKNGYEVEMRGWVNGARKVEKHTVKLHAIRNVCPICGRLLSGYYEAKLQIRGNFTGPTIEWIEEEAERIGKSDNKAFYRHEQLKEGVDIFFGSKAAAKQIALGLKKHYGAELTTSFQVAGRREGKELRRTIISVRF